MKTTLEIPDPLFRRAKALAAQKGMSLKQLVTDALAEKLENARRPGGAPGWKALSGNLRDLRVETARILDLVEADSGHIDEDDR